MATVLVTGGSGFIGAIASCSSWQRGHRVRTTVRNLQREPEVRALLREGGAEPGDQLAFAAPQISSAMPGGPEAVAGCDHVLHVASPFPASVPKHEDELIVPAREGALRVLRAARDAGVKRVVLTSSFAAIGYGHKPQSTPFDETNWTNSRQRRHPPLRQVQDPRRAGGVGFHRPRGQRPRALGGQSGRRPRPGAGRGLLDLDPAVCSA